MQSPQSLCSVSDAVRAPWGYGSRRVQPVLLFSQQTTVRRASAAGRFAPSAHFAGPVQPRYSLAASFSTGEPASFSTNTPSLR
jgi:hypothetical protein